MARQGRVSTATQHFCVDLVFYNYLLKCFLLIDLKMERLAHPRVGQMDMSVRRFDGLLRGDGDKIECGHANFTALAVGANLATQPIPRCEILAAKIGAAWVTAGRCGSSSAGLIAAFLASITAKARPYLCMCHAVPDPVIADGLNRALEPFK
jgi:hypothetical protein